MKRREYACFPEILPVLLFVFAFICQLKFAASFVGAPSASRYGGKILTGNGDVSECIGWCEAGSALKAIEAGEAVLLDVREFGELVYSGAVGVQFENIPIMRWEHGMWLPRPEFIKNAEATLSGMVSHGKEILVLSRDGGARTRFAVKMLSESNLKPVRGVDGGWSSWEDARLPTNDDYGY